MLLTLPWVDSIVALMGLSGEAAVAATQYLTIELAMLPAIMMLRVGIACLRGAGDTVSGLATMTIVNVVNMVVSYLLVTGAGPAPKLGWVGLPLGTATGYLCGAAIVLGLLSLGRERYYLRPALLWPDRNLIWRLLRIGIPGGTDMMLITLAHLIYLRVILRLGDVAAAAHGVAVQIEALGYMPGAAFQIAAATLAGQYLGAEDYVRARRSVLMACGVASLLMVAAGVCFYIFAAPLAAFFLGDQPTEVVPLAARLLRIVSYAMLPLAVTMVLAGALRGAGDTRWPLLFTLLSLIAIRVPLACYMAEHQWTIPFIWLTIPGLGLGVVGAWYAAVIDIVLRCMLMVFRFSHGGWQRVKV